MRQGYVGRRIVGAVIGAAASLALTAPLANAATSIEVLSNRADLISGGDALVAVDLPAGTDPSAVTVTRNGDDVTSDFAPRPNGRFEGLLDGLVNGANTVAATVSGQGGAKITITNHLNGGPVLDGPQVQPWVCQSTAQDKQCNQPATYAYQYKSSVTGQFRAYDPKNPPADVAIS
jgi:hypothetical protein